MCRSKSTVLILTAWPRRSAGWQRSRPLSTYPLLVAAALSVGGLTAGPASAEPLRVDSAAAAEKKAYPELDEARQKLGKQDIDGALESFNAAAKAHADLPGGRILLAMAYFTANRPREGRVQLEKAVTENPNDPDAFLLMAEIALRDARWTDAALLSDKAIPLAKAFKGDPERKKDLGKRAYLNAAGAAKSQERWEDARKLLADLLKALPDSAIAHYRMGEALFELDKQKEAYAELQAASRMDEEIPSAEITLGQLYDNAKDRANAEKYMKLAVASEPKKLKTRLEVALWFLRIGQLDEAKAQIDEALAIDPNSPEALLLAGRIARFAKDYPTAQKYLEKSYLETPGASAVANELALALVEIGEDERKRAMTLADATLRQSRDAESAAILGWIYYRLGRMDDAERLFNSIASSGQPLTPDAIYFFATFADDRNRGETAKPMLDIALKSDAPFAYRAEAQKLYDRLSKKPAARAPRKAAPADAPDAAADDAAPVTVKSPAAKPAASKPPVAKPQATKPAAPKP
ncbi:MAG TPA: tetratricopeptide repeat protein [Pirellulales bacterium]|jgi:predicted Zn-dependent protease